jgi:2-iminobutanoate/2-iminopropanoate deaminase
MVRPADDLHGLRRPIVADRATTLGEPGAHPLMSDAIAWNGVLYLSGRAAVDPATGTVRATGFSEQLQIVLDDTLAVLERAGSGPQHVLRVECWLLDAADFAAWNAAYAATFPPPRPARTTLVVAGLPIEGLLVELQLTAGLPS